MDGVLTSDERLRLQVWADDNPANKVFLDKVLQGDMIWKDALKWMELEKLDQESWEKQLERRTLSKIASSVASKAHKPSRMLSKVIPYAAAILLFAVAAILYDVGSQKDASENLEVIHNIDPGGNRAQLTLANGRVIELSSARDGIVVGDKLTYNDGTIIPSDQYETISMATLTTPKGGKYQVTLPDGTKVWLNAASTLTYPTRFSDEQRVVALDGEAYFEVAQLFRKDSNRKESSSSVPFLVETPNQVVEVLGTQFNVMAYADEPATKTTLVEGLVLLKSNQGSLKLTPGEQGILQGSALSKSKVDVNRHIAWKNNKFIFYETELHAAMKDLSRWYNLEVIYEGEVPISHFYGEISREKGLAEVLKILEVGGVKFRMEKVGDMNRLVVSP
ncbi:FecR family protein [Parapedobacter tibetensis]|nr:FecR family protein [Parapedobacter tibetensis]